jgi:hypothetical protein
VNGSIDLRTVLLDSADVFRLYRQAMLGMMREGLTWGICFSLEANPSRLNEPGFVTVLPRPSLSLSICP